MNEEWTVIEEFPNYEISDLGRVRNIFTKRPRKVRIDRDGYHVLTLCKDGKYYYRSIHKMVCQNFNGPQPTPNHQALHKDDDKDNNVPGNLYWGLHQSNMNDMIINGKSAAGERHAEGRLDWTRVREIRNKASHGQKQSDLAREYNVTEQLISQIIRNKIWIEPERRRAEVMALINHGGK